MNLGLWDNKTGAERGTFEQTCIHMASALATAARFTKDDIVFGTPNQIKMNLLKKGTLFLLELGINFTMQTLDSVVAIKICSGSSNLMLGR